MKRSNTYVYRNYSKFLIVYPCAPHKFMLSKVSSFAPLVRCSFRLFSTGRRRYLYVPFLEKDEAKAKGAQWDPVLKLWFVVGLPLSDFSKWRRQYLEIPSHQVSLAKAAGARWDEKSERWYITCNMDIAPFRSWIKDLENPREPPKGLIFFDIETTGLPLKGFEDYRQISFFEPCRVVQLSYILCNSTTLDEQSRRNFIVKVDGFNIENHVIHGITNEISSLEGVHFTDIAKHLEQDWSMARYLVAHNAVFDVNVLKSELYRYRQTALLGMLDKMTTVCTMKKTKHVINLPSKVEGKKKNPSLKELYKFATGVDLKNHHNSMDDTVNLHHAIKILKEKNLFSLE